MALQIDARIPTRMPRLPRRLRAGMYQVERAAHIAGTRALLWGYECATDRRVLIERIADVGETQLRAVLARRPTLLTLEHPQLARCIDSFVEDGALYFVLVTGPGQILSEAAGSVINDNDIIDIGIHLCNVLNFARYQADLRQDISVDPAMVFLTNGGRMKFTGIAALLGIDTPRFHSRFTSDNGTRDSRAVFSIGAMLHSLLTGWSGVYQDGAPSLAALRPDLAVEYSQTITRAIHPDSAARWADSAELRYALLPLLG